MTNFRPYLVDRGLEDEPPLQTYTFHFTRDYHEKDYDFSWRFNALKGFRAEVNFNYRADPRIQYKQEQFFLFAYGCFVIVLQEPQFARYAKQLAKTMLLVDPESIVVIDRKTGQFSGVHPRAKNIEDRIRVDMLDFFQLEGGDVTVR